ncbi:MAG: hypothetical protein NVSMB42_06940 [Herpetosiphon sp.]
MSEPLTLSQGRIDYLAILLQRYGVATPALMLLHLGQPVAPLMGSCLVGFTPLLPEWGARLAADVAVLLEDQQALAALESAVLRHDS